MTRRRASRCSCSDLGVPLSRELEVYARRVINCALKQPGVSGFKRVVAFKVVAEHIIRVRVGYDREIPKELDSLNWFWIVRSSPGGRSTVDGYFRSWYVLPANAKDPRNRWSVQTVLGSFTMNEDNGDCLP